MGLQKHKVTLDRLKDMHISLRIELVYIIALVLSNPVQAKVVRMESQPSQPNDAHRLKSMNDNVKDYLHCYQLFQDHFGRTYTDMCLVRQKLILCKQKVKAAFPKVDDLVVLLSGGQAEYIATFWCTHEPDPYFPMEALYYKFHHCPNVYPFFIVLPQDFSPHARLLLNRALLAYFAFKSINVDHLTNWHPQSNYSDPADPVYHALSSYYCAHHHYIQYNTQILDKYWFMGYIYREFNEKLSYYSRRNIDGLHNWQPSMCPDDPEDPMEKILNICDLKTWLKLQVNTSLEECHVNNTAVRGATCVVMFHTRLLPYTDIHLFMTGFCRPVQQLQQCWQQLVEMCPKQTMNSDMDVLIQIHQLVCDLSLQNSSLVWDIIYRWSDAIRKVEGFQVSVQEFAAFLFGPNNSPAGVTHVLRLPFGSTLNITLSTHQPHIAPQILSLMQQLVIYLDKISLVYTNRFQGLDILHDMFLLEKHIASIISIALYGPVELFLTLGGFIDYDTKNFQQWTFFN